ncbi:YjfB family protein [Sutcliffiella horikoshii]|uniref:YjfB family protein n=1 Tax=Sutcliffiella horikoshii TaxID=79883 RepID=UPI003CEA4F5F
MDIAVLSIALSQSQVQHQASISVMKKAMGNAEQQGEAVRNLLNSNNASQVPQPMHPHLGRIIDMKS